MAEPLIQSDYLSIMRGYLWYGAQRPPRLPFHLVDEVQHPGFGGVAGTLSGLQEEEDQEEP